MTRDEILNMPAGRELDALVAEKVLGLMVDNEFEEPFVPALRDKYDEWGILPNYSTNIAAAWEVIEKVYELGYPMRLFGYKDDYACTMRFTVHAETASLVICRAALLATIGEKE